MADNDQRLGSKRNRRSKRMSRSYPRSEPSRWSNEATSNDIGYDNQMGSVRVKLNDISKLLHNSPNLQTVSTLYLKVIIFIILSDFALISSFEFHCSKIFYSLSRNISTILI